MTDPAVPGVCYVCAGPPRDGEYSIPEDLYPGRWCHLSCLNTPAARQIRDRWAEQDPVYRRYREMSTLGREAACPGCGEACRLSPRARGMGAGSWEACCTRCSSFTLLNAYAHPAPCAALAEAEQRFLRAPGDEGWRDEVRRIAAEADALLDQRTCACGGAFSLAAAPRCPGCGAVVQDSCFHYAYRAA